MAYGSFSTGSSTAISNSWTTLFTSTGTPREILNVMVGADNKSATITDSLEVRALVAIDDAPTNFTDEPVFQRSFEPSTTGEEYLAFSLYGYKHFRVQAQSAGATDDYDVNFTRRSDGVSA